LKKSLNIIKKNILFIISSAPGADVSMAEKAGQFFSFLHHPASPWPVFSHSPYFLFSIFKIPNPKNKKPK
jgi:hypothetical protein